MAAGPSLSARLGFGNNNNENNNSNTDDVEAAYTAQVDKTVSVEPASPIQYVAAPAAPYVSVMQPAGPGDDGIKVGAWDADFWGCFTDCVPNCCMVTFFPCISMSQIVARLGITSYTNALAVFVVLILFELIMFSVAGANARSTDLCYDYYYGYYYYCSSTTFFSAYYAIAYVVQVVFWLAIWQVRNQVRARYQIPGSCIGDCLATFFCSCCTMAQMATHVKSYKPGTCDFGAPDTLPAYQI